METDKCKVVPTFHSTVRLFEFRVIALLLAIAPFKLLLVSKNF